MIGYPSAGCSSTTLAATRLIFKGGMMMHPARVRKVDIFRELLDEELEIVAGFCREEYLPQRMPIIQAGVYEVIESSSLGRIWG
jgi:hypothetical protein